jgi:hypothetical protein
MNPNTLRRRRGLTAGSSRTKALAALGDGQRFARAGDLIEEALAFRLEHAAGDGLHHRGSTAPAASRNS